MTAVGKAQAIIHPGGPTQPDHGVKIYWEVKTRPVSGGGTEEYVEIEIHPLLADFELALEGGGTQLMAVGTVHQLTVSGMAETTPTVVYDAAGNPKPVKIVMGGPKPAGEALTVGVGFLPLPAASMSELTEVHLVIAAEERLVRLKLIKV